MGLVVRLDLCCGENKADGADVVEDYVLFDCPGQVELFTHHSSLRNIFFRIQKLGYRVCSHPSSTFLGARKMLTCHVCS